MVNGKNKYLILGLLICVLGLFSSCKKETLEDEIYDSLFFTEITKEYSDSLEDNFKVNDLTVYSYDSYYYYNIKYEHESEYVETSDYDMLYIYNALVSITFFPIKNSADCYEYFYKYYTKFLEAKEKGIVKVYTEEEINNLIETYSPSGEE